MIINAGIIILQMLLLLLERAHSLLNKEKTDLVQYVHSTKNEQMSEFFSRTESVDWVVNSLKNFSSTCRICPLTRRFIKLNLDKQAHF